MVTRGDILVLGITAGVSGGLIGGVLLFAGMAMIAAGTHAGWLLVLPSAPLSAVVGWIMAKRLARQL